MYLCFLGQINSSNLINPFTSPCIYHLKTGNNNNNSNHQGGKILWAIWNESKFFSSSVTTLCHFISEVAILRSLGGCFSARCSSYCKPSSFYPGLGIFHPQVENDSHARDPPDYQPGGLITELTYDLIQIIDE